MIYTKMAPGYENLVLLQKIEVFEYALENTTGQDLYRVLWPKSANSEHWLERRATYTRSLAVNSMVGHILGLGDRHPSNLMLLRNTGQVVHIDFGDCFEVAMTREKYPEKIPFRLTRMLTHAMEVGFGVLLLRAITDCFTGQRYRGQLQEHLRDQHERIAREQRVLDGGTRSICLRSFDHMETDTGRG